MAKYILKQEAIYVLTNEAKIHNNPIKRSYARAAALIEQITAEDVQPVVCCKDCIERPHCQTHSDDFYCAFGERSDSND